MTDVMTKPPQAIGATVSPAQSVDPRSFREAMSRVGADVASQKLGPLVDRSAIIGGLPLVFQ